MVLCRFGVNTQKNDDEEKDKCRGQFPWGRRKPQKIALENLVFSAISKGLIDMLSMQIFTRKFSVLCVTIG